MTRENQMSNSCFAVWGVVIAGIVFVPHAMSTEGSPVLLPEVTVKKLFKVTDRYPESDSSNSIDEREDELADGNTQFRLGEDVGEQGEDSELLTVRQQLQHHLELLRKRSSGEMANGIEPLQFDILRRLDSLIDQDDLANAKGVVAMPSEGLAGQQAGVGSTGENTVTENPTIVTPTGDLLESTWNQLPPSVQIPLRASSAQPFLPGYEQLLQQFYWKLNKN